MKQTMARGKRETHVTIQYVLLIILSVLGILFSALLMISSLTKTAIANNMIEQKMMIEWESPLLEVLMILGFLAIGVVLLRSAFNTNILSLFVLTIVFHAAAGFAFIYFARSAPGGDAASVFNMAVQLSEGDLSFVGSPDSYLSFYPQQIGLTVFLSIILKILKILPYKFAPHHAIKVLYVILNCVTVTFGYLSVKEIWRSKKISTVFLYLSVFNLPFIMYSSFIYGEIPSLCAMSVAIYFLCRTEKSRGVQALNIVMTVLFTVLSVFVRKNSLIFMIASIIVLLLIFMGNKKKEYLITAACVLVLSVAVLPITLKIFELKTGRDIDSGVTMYSYLAMGMQDNSERGPGWYNGFNFDTYKNTGMDAKEANRISNDAINERIDYFKENPKECFAFYRDKFLTQWSDPTLASCQATYTDFGGRTEFIKSVYDGDYNIYYVLFCNMFQNVIYVGVFIWSLTNFRKIVMFGKKGWYVSIYIGFITIIGGFLFHMMWEANSRYIFPYAMLLIPYAAFGYGNLIEHNIINDYDD